MPQVIGHDSDGLSIFKHFKDVIAANARLQTRPCARGADTTSHPEDLVEYEPIAALSYPVCDKPSLGSFACYLNGTMEGRSPADGGPTVFEVSGTMQWYDIWDFDPKRLALPGEKSTEQQTRTGDAEWGVRLANMFLPGTPFDVLSPGCTGATEEYRHRASMVGPSQRAPSGANG